MSRRRLRWLVVSLTALLAIGAALGVALATNGSSSSAKPAVNAKLKAAAGGIESSAETRFSGGNERLPSTFDGYRMFQRAYPADAIALSWQRNAKATFNKIAARTPEAPNPGIVGSWQPYGPTTPIEPGGECPKICVRG